MVNPTSLAPSTNKKGLAQKWKVLIAVVFGIFMVILDTTVVNVAFQTLRAEFGATLNDSQWIISVYVLSLGISTPLSGYLSDRFGIKKVYLTGLGIFVVGSIMCGIAPNLGFLIAARILQDSAEGSPCPGLSPAPAHIPANETGGCPGRFWNCHADRPGGWTHFRRFPGRPEPVAGHLLYQPAHRNPGHLFGPALPALSHQ